jgi:hypothetical protein
MKAIFVKELRENARWAALMMLVLAGLMASDLNGTAQSGESIVGVSFLAVTSIAFAAGGLAIGLLQVLQDARRARWEFIIHRPTARSNIFLAKAAAGMLLYLLGAGVAFGAMVLWAASPGRVAGPFEWHMVLPGMVDLFGGTVWYAAGLCVGMRPARWLGSRLMPIGAALACSILATAHVITVTQALLVLAAGLLIILPAAWASFVSAGQYQRQPIIARALQTICIGAGVSLALIAATSILRESIRMVTRYEPANIGVQYMMDQNLDLYRITFSTAGGTEVADLSGHVLPPAEAKVLMARQLQLCYFLLGDRSALPWTTRLRLQGYRRAGSYLHRLTTRSLSAGLSNVDVSVTERPFNLFYIVHRRTIEGYDLQLRTRILGIGPDGFAAGAQIPHPFPQPLTRLPMISPDHWLLASTTDAWQLDLPDLKQVHHTSPADPILDIGAFPPDVPTNPLPNKYITVVTSSTIHIYSPDAPPVHLPIEHGPPQCQMLQIGRSSADRYLVWYTQSAGDSQTSWIVEADQHGNIVRRAEIPPHPIPPAKPDWIFRAIDLMASPPILSLPRTDGIALALIALTALASEAVTMLICNRFSFGRAATITWSILTLLFGWTALLTLLCMREMPARIQCPGCGRRRVVNRALCEHCGVPFDPPQPQGIEIFQSDNTSEVTHAALPMGVG